MYPLGRVIDFSAMDTVFMKAVLVKNKLHWDSRIFKHFLPVLTCLHALCCRVSLDKGCMWKRETPFRWGSTAVLKSTTLLL